MKRILFLIAMLFASVAHAADPVWTLENTIDAVIGAGNSKQEIKLYQYSVTADVVNTWKADAFALCGSSQYPALLGFISGDNIAQDFLFRSGDEGETVSYFRMRLSDRSHYPSLVGGRFLHIFRQGTTIDFAVDASGSTLSAASPLWVYVTCLDKIVL